MEVQQRLLVQVDANGELADEAEARRAERELAVQLDVELALRVDPAGDAHAGETEEVGARAEGEDPLADAEIERVPLHAGPERDGAAADDDVEAGREVDDLEDLDRAVEREPEGVGPDRHAVGLTRDVRRVQPQPTAPADLDDLEHVDVERHGEAEDDSL